LSAPQIFSGENLLHRRLWTPAGQCCLTYNINSSAATGENDCCSDPVLPVFHRCADSGATRLFRPAPAVRSASKMFRKKRSTRITVGCQHQTANVPTVRRITPCPPSSIYRNSVPQCLWATNRESSSFGGGAALCLFNTLLLRIPQIMTTPHAALFTNPRGC
jgi:hypothetical protein